MNISFECQKCISLKTELDKTYATLKKQFEIQLEFNSTDLLSKLKNENGQNSIINGTLLKERMNYGSSVLSYNECITQYKINLEKISKENAFYGLNIKEIQNELDYSNEIRSKLDRKNEELETNLKEMENINHNNEKQLIRECEILKNDLKSIISKK